MKKESFKRRRGMAVLLVALMSGVLFGMVGLSFDVSLLYLVKTKMSAAADSAALAGARSLSRGGDIPSQTANAQVTASNYFRANFPVGYFMTASSTVNSTVTQSSVNVRQVATSASAEVPLFFLRILPGVPSSITVNAAAIARRRDTNIMMVLDRSGSMHDSGSCDPMKAAAAGFVSRFAEQRDYMGMETFATSAFIDYPIANNFKSSSPPLIDVINLIDCAGWTNSSTALWNAYSALVQLNLPGALNAIVFFTDGQPTALTGTFAINSASPCSNHADKTGVIAGNTVGLLKFNNGPVPIANDSVVITGDNSCQFMTRQDQVATDVGYIPNLDLFGSSTNNGYMSVNGDGAGHVHLNSVQNASINAADDAAFRIRNGANVPGVGSLSNVMILSIGLGNSTAPPNADFLKRVSNDPGASNYDSTKPAGLYVLAQTASDLDTAFQRVASEILRLAQ